MSKAVTANQIRKNWKKGAKKRAMKNLAKKRALAKKARDANEPESKEPRG